MSSWYICCSETELGQLMTMERFNREIFMILLLISSSNTNKRFTRKMHSLKSGIMFMKRSNNAVIAGSLGTTEVTML